MNAQAQQQPIRSDPGGPILRRDCGCNGSCGSCSDKKKPLQRAHAGHSSSSSKFGQDFSGVPAMRSIDVRVGATDDHFEKEADAVANAVATERDDAPPIHAAAPRVQRELDDEEDEAAEEDDSEDVINETGQPHFEPGASKEGGKARVPVGSGAGSPLTSDIRTSMEDHIGHDFSSVRVHSDSDAARAASSVHARAFTVGSDIYFGSGRFEPHSQSGKRLLAHELTHVVQQAGGRSALQRAPEQPKKTAKPPAKKAEKKETKKKEEPKKEEKKKPPCATGTCSAKDCPQGKGAEVFHPACGNETCSSGSAADSKFFIKRIYANRKTYKAIAVWGDATTETAVSAPFDITPNPTLTPAGDHTVGVKCGICHTNNHGDHMAWFTSFKNSYQYGIHNSQPMGSGYKSHGCVRAFCACAKEIQDNTTSGTSKVLVHEDIATAKPPRPKAGKKLSKTSICSPDLFEALPPDPEPAPAAKPKAKDKEKAKDEKPKESKPKKATPAAPPKKKETPKPVSAADEEDTADVEPTMPSEEEDVA